MTVGETTIRLVDFFLKKDTFCLSDPGEKQKKDDFKELFIISEDPERDRASLLIALKELESSGFVCSVHEKEKTIWVLKKKLHFYSQTITLSAETANTVSRIINGVCEASNDTENTCNPLNLTDADIQTLCNLCLNLIESKEKSN